jgi:dolichol-phosphate mannosyltransferase
VTSRQSVLVIVPTYNEAGSVREFFSRLDAARHSLAENYSISILHVDDNSPDCTAELVRTLSIANLSQIIRPHKTGLGPAYIEAFEWGLSGEYQLFVQMDADNSHHPEELARLLQQANPENLVLGTRWMPGGSVENWPLARRLISRLGTRYASQGLKIPLRDITSGYRVLGRKALERLDLNDIQAHGYGFQVEIIARMHAQQIEIVEIPITFTERREGRSKMTVGIALEAAAMVSKWRISRIAGTGIYRR